MNGLEDSDIVDIEIELVGSCNLRCPLCASVVFPDKVGYTNIRSVSEWNSQLDRYSGLKSVCISGICSEPTLYPDIVKLIDYFVGRGVTIELFTNASTHDKKWWNSLGKHLTINDMVIFTVCGSTNDIHGKYRVGQTLDQVIENSDAFREGNPNKNDCIQHILFEYNSDDFSKNMKPLINRFSKSLLLKTPPYAERFKVKNGDGINMPPGLERKYLATVVEADRRRRSGNFKILCRSKKLKYLSIDQYGNEYPCFLYRLFSGKKFDKSDFSEIESFKYEFCYDCEERTSKMLEMFGIESMV